MSALTEAQRRAYLYLLGSRLREPAYVPRQVSDEEMARLIRAGRKKVARQITKTYFLWDARRPRWRMTNPPNCACATGMALLAAGYPGPWDSASAEQAACSMFGTGLVQDVARMNDQDNLRWDRIAAALSPSKKRSPR